MIAGRVRQRTHLLNPFRAAAVGATILTVVIGNMRPTPSEAAATQAQPLTPAVLSVTSDLSSPLSFDLASIHGESNAVDGSADSVGQEEAMTDEARLVPALYSWDPDVRFVYFRHVSKWM